MLNYNHITLVGMLTNDPKIEAIEESTKCTFVLAIDRPYRKDDGTAESDFIPVVMFGKIADVADKYLRKGRPILIEGRIQIREITKGKSSIYITEVVAENFQILESLKGTT